MEEGRKTPESDWKEYEEIKSSASKRLHETGEQLQASVSEEWGLISVLFADEAAKVPNLSSLRLNMHLYQLIILIITIIDIILC